LDKIVVTSLLIIAGVVAAVVLYNAVYPAIAESGDALTRRQRQIDERLQSQIEIIHAAPYGVSSNEVWVWVKNVGSRRISAIESCDVFFGPEGNFGSLSYGASAGGWTYEVEQGDNWDPTTTLKITIYNYDYDDNGVGDNLADGTRYFLKMTTPSGVSDDYYFSK
jgi:archaellum component FlaF (FlaF/FlaG flagellin family)